jgi:mRNA-degrading endonuclease RelE of RelBE toxin-antitoxin system
MVKKNYIAFYSKTFQKEFEKLSDVHREMVMKKIAMMEENPFYPSLRTKKMGGGTGYYESSINMDIRILWYFEGDRIIILTDVGHHDVLKKY